MSGGREFQRLGADLLKARHPMVVRLADGADSWVVEEEWRVQEDMWIGCVDMDQFSEVWWCQVMKDLESEV